MKARRTSIQRAYLGVAGVVLALLVLVQLASALDGGHDLAFWTVDGGGARSSGDSYELSGTIGQADAGAMAGGDYVLTGGFWSGAYLEPPHIYIPLVLKETD